MQECPRTRERTKIMHRVILGLVRPRLKAGNFLSEHLGRLHGSRRPLLICKWYGVVDLDVRRGCSCRSSEVRRPLIVRREFEGKEKINTDEVRGTSSNRAKLCRLPESSRSNFPSLILQK